MTPAKIWEQWENAVGFVKAHVTVRSLFLPDGVIGLEFLLTRPWELMFSLSLGTWHGYVTVKFHRV